MNMPQRASALSSMMEGLSLPQPPRISIRGQRFSLIDASGNEMQCNLIDQTVGYYLDVVIVHANPHKSKIMYDSDKPWTPGSTDPPVCWSDNGVAPSASAATPQARTCGECQWNVRGSATSKVSGTAIKACQDRKKLAVYVVGDPAGAMYQLQVTPNALSNLSAYGKWVARHPSPSGQGACDVRDIVTRVYFEAGQQSTITFGAVGPIDQVMAGRVQQALAGSEIDEIIGLNDTPIMALPAPQPAQQVNYAPAPQHPGNFTAPIAHPAPQWQPPPPPPPASWPAQPAQPQAPSAPQGQQWPAQPAGQHQQSFMVAQPAGQAPQPGFQAPGMTPAAPTAGKGSGRGGKRVGAGRKVGDAPVQQFGIPMPAAQPASEPQVQQAPFQAPGVQAAPPPAGPVPGPQFGLQPGAAPPSDLNAALDRAFSTPIPGR